MLRVTMLLLYDTGYNLSGNLRTDEADCLYRYNHLHGNQSRKSVARLRNPMYDMTGTTHQYGRLLMGIRLNYGRKSLRSSLLLNDIVYNHAEILEYYEADRLYSSNPGCGMNNSL